MAASPSLTSDEQFAIGALLDDRYRIEGVLGTGGMGRVYRAEHTKIGKSVAIKVLHADLHRNREASQRFQREAIASGRLDHPNIVGVSDFGVLDDGACYLVMEVLEGESLGDRLARDERIHWLEAIEILRGVLAGLRHAHERGVVHRDIKPDNVFLARKDGDAMIKILDFGIAKLYAGSADDPASTRAGLTVGTPAYLSPEQAVGGEITPASDIYSASIVMYEMLAGRAPFEDKDPLKMLGAHVGQRPPAFADIAPGIDIPPPLEDIVLRGLAKSPGDRIATATDYLALLDAFAPPAHVNGRLSTAPVAVHGAASGPVSGAIAIPMAAGLSGAVSAPMGHAATGPALTTPLPVTYTTGGAPVVNPAYVTGGAPVVSHPYATGGAPVVNPAYATGGAPVVSNPYATGGAPVVSHPYATGGAPVVVSDTSTMPTALPPQARMVSLADVSEPIPLSWIVRSGFFIGVVIVGAIALALVKHCASGTPAAAPVPAGSAAIVRDSDKADPAARKPDGKIDAKAEAKPDGKIDAKAEAKIDAKPDAKADDAKPENKPASPGGPVAPSSAAPGSAAPSSAAPGSAAPGSTAPGSTAPAKPAPKRLPGRPSPGNTRRPHR